ncbi:nuclease-related domain-containing protein [Streptomyces achromogenes]|uniref:nuclease-related domain-containing protein n=1 Tax=Streptomyces achromogenes TaxID=67255 RepID=UPI0036F653FC
MTGAGGSAARWGEEQRRAARKGLWRKLLAALGWSTAARRADALAARTRQGSLGEQWTAAALTRLPPGWHVLHDRRFPGPGRSNLDHLLVAPGGAGIVVIDSKKWHAGWRTRLVRGRVHCGGEDRHAQVEAVAGYARRVARLLGVPEVMVVPLVVVHGSSVDDGCLTARVHGWMGPVHVLGPDWLVPTLATAPRGPDARQGDALAERVAQVFPPYLGGA